MHLILMGPQGSGKGTQADAIGPELGLVKLSTGDLFRSTIASGTDLGQLLKEILARGDLVPDDLTLSMVEQRVEEIGELDGIHGALFDGFPRTKEQAEGLELLLEKRGERVNAVIEIVVPRDVLIERLSGRWVCPKCGTAYHMVFNPPKVDTICDKDGTQLIQRDDDKPDAIKRRLALYDDQTKPLLDYYRERGLLSQVNGEQSIEDVSTEILAKVKQTSRYQ